MSLRPGVGMAGESWKRVGAAVMVCNSSANSYRSVTRAVTSGLNIRTMSMTGVSSTAVTDRRGLVLNASA